MSKISIDFSEVASLRKRLTAAIPGVRREVQATNRSWVPRLRETLIAHSSGRPGPEVETGAYNAAYIVETVDDDMAITADNPSPQSDRLEYGFVGEDAAGRAYHQPPFPHFRPTLDEVSEPYAEDIGGAFGRWWHG